MRKVATVFTPNDRRKNAVTAEKYQSAKGVSSAIILILKPSVVNAVTMYDAKLVPKISQFS